MSKAVLFESYVHRTLECWEWTGGRDGRGYGKFWTGERHVGAHRFAYELWVATIPPELTIDHLCQNKICVRPEHLEVVTRAENTMRGDTMGSRHAAQTHCVNGHPFDEENTYITKEGWRQCRSCSRERKARASFAWGPYEGAIRRWESVLGRPAPAPVDDKGRLAPAFVCWMQGFPEGWVDGMTRTQALKALGNAVVPQQGAAAFQILTALEAAYA